MQLVNHIEQRECYQVFPLCGASHSTSADGVYTSVRGRSKHMIDPDFKEPTDECGDRCKNRKSKIMWEKNLIKALWGRIERI